MTPRQIEAQKAGILARTKALRDAGVPFHDYRVMQVLDAAFLLKDESVPDWETVYTGVLHTYGPIHPCPHCGQRYLALEGINIACDTCLVTAVTNNPSYLRDTDVPVPTILEIAGRFLRDTVTRDAGIALGLAR